MAAVTMPVLVPVNVPSRFVRQHGRLQWKARTSPCDVQWWQDHVPGETSKLEIKLRSGESAKVGECILDTLVGRAIVLAVSGFKECVDRLQTSVAQGIARTVGDGSSH